MDDGTHQVVQVSGLKLVGVASESLQRGNSIQRAPGGEDVGESQAGQRGVPTGAAAVDGEALGIDLALLHEKLGGRGCVLHVHDAPPLLQQLPVSAPVPGAPPVVDISDREPPGGPVLAME